MITPPTSAASTFLDFSIRSAAGFALVWISSQMLSSPLLRYRLWLLASLGVAGAWIRTIPALLPAGVQERGLPFASPAAHPGTVFTVRVATDVSGIPSWVKSPTHWLLLYASIAGLLLLRSLIDSLSVSISLQQEGMAVPPTLSKALLSACAETAMVPPALVVVRGLASPSTAGWWKPCILIPEGLADFLDAQQLRDVLRHELVHIKRLDYLIDRMVSAACALVFFHPGIWIAYAHIRRERELSCDEAVAGKGTEERAVYANSLLRIARWRASHSCTGAGNINFLKPESSLRRRVRRLVIPDGASTTVRSARNAVAGILLFSTAGLPLVQFRTEWIKTPEYARTAELARIVYRVEPAHSKRILLHRSRAAAKRSLTNLPGTATNIASMGQSISLPTSDLAVLASSTASKPPQVRFVLSGATRADAENSGTDSQKADSSGPGASQIPSKSHPNLDSAGSVLVRAGVDALWVAAAGAGADRDGPN